MTIFKSSFNLILSLHEIGIVMILNWIQLFVARNENHCRGNYKFYYRKGPSIKDVCSQEEEVFSSADSLRTRRRGFFRCGRPHFLKQKTSIFLKFMVCPHGQRGRWVELVRTREEGANFFAILCGVLYGRPLILKVNLVTIVCISWRMFLHLVEDHIFCSVSTLDIP